MKRKKDSCKKGGSMKLAQCALMLRNSSKAEESIKRGMDVAVKFTCAFPQRWKYYEEGAEKEVSTDEFGCFDTALKTMYECKQFCHEYIRYTFCTIDQKCSST